MIICLYNSYDKLKVHDIHVRSVARAAPVCYAFGGDLVLLDFPEPMYEHVMENTTIGESGIYLKLLQENHKFSELSHKLPLALPVITTSNPDTKKQVTTHQLVEWYIRGEKLAFIIGLGRKGLPSKLRKKGRYHWDVTGKKVSLETCTAIGCITAVFSTLVQTRRGTL
ncbi:MAG: DUF531 family protein [Candidatus Methanofastidiosia archaeon]|jgi:hypothetical protein